MKLYRLLIVGLMCLSPVVFSSDAAGLGGKTAITQRVNKPLVFFVNRAQSTVTISLESNPSTGYRWFMARANHELVDKVKVSFQRGEGVAKPGKPGLSVWQVTLDDDAFDFPQQVKLVLVNQPPGRHLDNRIVQPVYVFTVTS